MAYYAALTSLLQTIYQIPQPTQQIMSFQDKVSRLLVILDDSSQKTCLKINHLEKQIRDASYEAEDIIERSMVLQGLEKIMDEFDSILEALSNMIKEGKVADLQPRNPSKFVANYTSTLVGLDEDLITIKDRLTGSMSKLDIISIVGMGGIGKTTLARSLYNDSLIQHRFDTCAWIVVSQEYHLREMFTDLLGSTRHSGDEFDDDELHHKTIEQLAEHLYKSLKGRRYLIVMDDVWDTKAWDEVRRFFPNDNNGSRIILTTRLSEVAIYANSCSPIHHMNLLSLDESWNLLCEKVFGKECCPSELENIGKKIAENFKGLPLAIVVIGGLLSKGSRTQDYWEYIAENVNSAVSRNDDQFMEILSLSYKSLPHHLKPCFLYMGVFPEDHVIFVSKLIKLWIAEGFIKSLPDKRFEEVAEDYLKDLIDRSLILVHKKNNRGGIKTCTIHDMLRELCVKESQDEKFLQILNSNIHSFRQGKNNQRRVSIHSNTLYHLQDVHDSSIRLLYFCNGFSYHQLLSIAVSCGLLRVLDALTVIFNKFPIQILELVHLRYLSFIYKGKSKFPESISKLWNLQTLIVYRGVFFISTVDDTLYLPLNIWGMSQLRHLLFEKSFLPTQIMEKDCVILENLQMLSGIINFKCTKKVMDWNFILL